MARERRPDRERFKYGICLNEDEMCPKWKSKEIQQIPLRKDLVCSECGKELRECPPPQPLVPVWKKIAVIVGAVCVAVALGFGGYALFSKGEKATSTSSPHSLLISSITADGWSVTPEDLTTIDDGDTIWFQADKGTDASAGVTPTIVPEDSTAVLEPATVTIKQKAAMTVTVKAGEQSRKYVMAVKPVEGIVPPPPTHSLLISSVTADGWSVTPEDLTTIDDGDTIWFQADKGTDASAGVTPTIVPEDSTAVLEPATVTIKQKTAVTVAVKAGEQSRKYVMAVKKKPIAPPVRYVTLKCGIYTGPKSGHTPDGFGGEIKVTRSYSIDLKNTDHETVEISAGDIIVQTKFRDGELLQGLLKRTNGEQKFLNGISERLL